MFLETPDISHAYGSEKTTRASRIDGNIDNTLSQTEDALISPADSGRDGISPVDEIDRKSSVGSVSDGARLPRISEDDTASISQTPTENEDHVLFQNITYLGAATVKSPRNEAEIVRNIAVLNADTQSQTAVLVDLLVPRVPQGMVVLYEPQTEDEMGKYPVFRIIFCARGGRHPDPLAFCFAFTFGHGNNEEAAFLCHAFRCPSVEQVSKIIMCFSSAFRKPVTSQLPQGESVFVFDVCMELKEDDGRGGLSFCPRESRDCFKVSSNRNVDILSARWKRKTSLEALLVCRDDF